METKSFFGTQDCEKKCGRDECVFKCAYPTVIPKVECCAKGGDVNTGLFNCDRGECIHANITKQKGVSNKEFGQQADITNKGIEAMANDTINRLDSHAGKIIHIAAFKTGAEWYREQLREIIKAEISDLDAERRHWSAAREKGLANVCKIRISAHKGVLEMMSEIAE